MHRVYLGNLTKQVNEQTINRVFEDHGLTARNVMMKDSYAFVDCPDEDSVNKAVECLQGLKLNGLPMQVEPAFARQRNGTSRLVIHGMPAEADESAIRELLQPHGMVKELSVRPEADGRGNVVMVTFASPEQAQLAKEKLDGVDFRGTKLKVGFASRQVEAAQYHQTNGFAHAPHVAQKGVDFPLRLLIPSQSVGAIIGRSGQTIRSITQRTKARIDVLRHDSVLPSEKVVIIVSAHAQHCIDASVEILKILYQEPAAAREPELRMLASNNLCGRLIGRQGTVIKGMMEETGTSITVSVVNYQSPDRMISIKGKLDNVGQAAERVYSKLKAAFESDMKNVKYNPQLYYGGNTMMMIPATMLPHTAAAAAGLPMQQQWYPSPVQYPAGPWMQHAVASSASLQHFDWPGNYAPTSLMTCFVYVPKAAVGSIIGSKGAFLNFLKTQIHATCQVQEKSDEAGGDDGDAAEVAIKITGTPDAVWRAQTFIFDKIKTEGFTGNEPAKLRCDIFVPKARVGRLIGKGGQNVRHIQSVSDASIRVQGFGGTDKETPASQQPSQDGVAETRVQIIGNICAQTIAQSLIRQLLVAAALQQPIYSHALPPGGHGAAVLAASPATPITISVASSAAVSPAPSAPAFQAPGAAAGGASPQSHLQSAASAASQPGPVASAAEPLPDAAEPLPDAASAAAETYAPGQAAAEPSAAADVDAAAVAADVDAAAVASSTPSQNLGEN